jgi:hypothetical protein
MIGNVMKPVHAIATSASTAYRSTPGAAQPEVMKVTIVVLNYNYAHFLAQAIDSALAQTYANCEVVVVDNGSKDHSLEVIQRYGKRVRLVRQAVNIGQGQGYNLGFEAARGEWLIWLDADDLLDADAIATCMSMAQDDTSKVQFPLQLVDAQAKPLGGVVPFLRHHGDVVPLIHRFGHYAGPPGSGNLYRRSAIAPYFPVPPQDWPICTDTVPFITAPFHGKVVDTLKPLGSYRLHGKSAPDAPGYTGNFKVTMATEVRLNTGSRDRALALLRGRSGIHIDGPFLTLPVHVRHRIISWRSAPQTHPFSDDSSASLWRLMNDSLRECPGYNGVQRLMMRAWAAGVLFLPKSLSQSVMGASGSSPMWSRVLRWSRSMGA